MTPPKNIAVYGHFGGWNAGDEIILESVVHTLRQSDPDVAIDVISGSFHSSAIRRYAAIDVNPVRLKSMGCVKSLRSRRLVAGGGQMMTGDVSFKGLLALLALISVSRLSGGRPLLLCIGTVGFSRRRSRLLARSIVEMCTTTVVRDVESFHELVDCGVSPRQLTLSADIVFNGAVAQRFSTSSDVPAPSTRRRPTILVVLHWSPMRSVVSVEAAEALLRRLEVEFPGASVIMQSHDRRQAFDDGGVAALSAKGGWKNVSFEPFDRLDELVARYRDADVVVAARMHPLIVSTVLGTPCVALSASRKTRALAERVGMPLSDIVDLDVLVEHIADALAGGPQSWDHLKGLVDATTEEHLGGR